AIGAPRPAGCISSGVVDRNCVAANDANFHQGTWTIGLDYQVTPNTLLYVTARKGYKSGGFNEYAPTAALDVFKPETVIDTEIGVKSDFTIAGMSTRIDLDAYRGNYNAIQRTTTVVFNGTVLNL